MSARGWADRLAGGSSDPGSERPELGPDAPARSNGPDPAPPGPTLRPGPPVPEPRGSALRVVLVSRDNMLAGALRSLIEAPGGVRMLDWHSDELDGAIRRADVVVVDTPPNLHERTFGIIDGRFLGRTVVLLQEGEDAEALPPGPSRAILYRPLQIAELWAAVTGAQPVAPPAPEPAAEPPAATDPEPGAKDGEAGADEPAAEAEVPDPGKVGAERASEPDAAPAAPEDETGDEAPMQRPGLPVAESGLLIGLSGRELEPVIGPGQVAPGMDEETFERLRRWGNRGGPPASGANGARRTNGTRAGRAKPAGAEARREQSRRRRAAKAEARAATREEVARQREARAAARDQARQAKQAERQAAQEASRQAREAQAAEKAAARQRARLTRAAEAETRKLAQEQARKATAARDAEQAAARDQARQAKAAEAEARKAAQAEAQQAKAAEAQARKAAEQAVRQAKAAEAESRRAGEAEAKAAQAAARDEARRAKAARDAQQAAVREEARKAQAAERAAAREAAQREKAARAEARKAAQTEASRERAAQAAVRKAAQAEARQQRSTQAAARRAARLEARQAKVVEIKARWAERAERWRVAREESRRARAVRVEARKAARAEASQARVTRRAEAGQVRQAKAEVNRAARARARQERAAATQARQEQSRQARAAQAEARQAARQQSEQARAARAKEQRTAREAAARAKSAEAEVKHEATRQTRAARAAERAAAQEEARRVKAARAEERGAARERAQAEAGQMRAAKAEARKAARAETARTPAGSTVAWVGGVVQPLLVVVVLAAVAIGAAGWRSGGGPDTQAGEVAVVRAAGGTGGGLVAQDPRVGPISPVHALAVGAWLRLTEAKASLEGTVREARVPGRFLLAGVVALTVVLFLLLMRVGPGTGAAAGPGPAPPQPRKRVRRVGGAALAGVLVALDPLLVGNARAATGTVLALVLALGALALAWGVPARPALRWLPLVAALGGLALLVSPLALPVLLAPVAAELLGGRYREAWRSMAALALAVGVWLLLPVWVAGQDLGPGQAGWLLGRPPGQGSLAASLAGAPLSWLLVAAGLTVAVLAWRHRSGARPGDEAGADRPLAWVATTAAGALVAVAVGYPAGQALAFATPAAAVALALAAARLAGAGVRTRGTARRVVLAGTAVALAGMVVAQGVDWASRYGRPDDGLGKLVATVAAQVPRCSAVNASGPDDRARLLAAGVTVTEFSDGPAAAAAGIRYFVLTEATATGGPLTPSLAAWVREHGDRLAAQPSRSLSGIELWHVDPAPLDPVADSLQVPGGMFSNVTGSACGGYRVADSQLGAFYTAYRAVGGKAVLGRPLGSVWTSDGPALQAFDTMVLGAVPAAGGPPAVKPIELPPQLAKLNVEAVADADIPLPSVRPPVTDRQAMALLDDALIARLYLGTDPAAATPEDWRRARERFGRPLGAPQTMPDGAVRQPFERAVLELPADGGPARPAALGRLAVRLGLVPKQAMRPEPVPDLPVPPAETRLDTGPLLRPLGLVLGLLALAAAAGTVLAGRSRPNRAEKAAADR